MADVEPLHALHYDLARTGGLQPVRRAALRRDRRRAAGGARRALALQRRAHRPARRATATPTRTPPAARRLACRRVVRPGPAAGAVGARAGLHRPGRAGAHAPRLPRARARRGLRRRAGSARTSARTPGPKEDRLRLTRATRPTCRRSSRCSPTPTGAAWAALAPRTEPPPVGRRATDDDGTVNRLWRVDRRSARSRPSSARSRRAELLIADGHHRYETARVVRRGDRRRGPAPLRADVPRRARGPGPDRVPDPPAGARSDAPTSTRRWRRRSGATSRSSELDDTVRARAAVRRRRSGSATSTPTSGGRSC